MRFDEDRLKIYVSRELHGVTPLTTALVSDDRPVKAGCL
jgi:hypothetical protein